LSNENFYVVPQLQFLNQHMVLFHLLAVAFRGFHICCLNLYLYFK